MLVFLVLRYLHNSALNARTEGNILLAIHRFHFLRYFTDDDVDNDDNNNVTDNDNNNVTDNDNNNDGDNDYNNVTDNDNHNDDDDNNTEAATRQFLIPNKSCSSRRNFPEAPRKKKNFHRNRNLIFFWLKSF